MILNAKNIVSMFNVHFMVVISLITSSTSVMQQKIYYSESSQMSGVRIKSGSIAATMNK